MTYKHKIQIRKASRNGSNRLKAIVDIDGIKDAVNTIRPDGNGILWLTINSPATIKVYTIK